MNDSATLNSDLIAEYLRQHPDLLCQHPELIEVLQWPEDPRASSLMQYQTLRLRRRNQQLEAQLKHLSSIAGENERLMQRLHQLTLDLMRTESDACFITRLFERLARDFSAASARLHLVDARPELADLDGVINHDGKCPDWLDKLIDKGQPYCGRLTRKKAQLLFPESAALVGSSALLPITGVGLLAIGSTDESRFYPGMGTVFLDLLSNTIAHRLTALESDDRKSA